MSSNDTCESETQISQAVLDKIAGLLNRDIILADGTRITAPRSGSNNAATIREEGGLIIAFYDENDNEEQDASEVTYGTFYLDGRIKDIQPALRD